MASVNDILPIVLGAGGAGFIAALAQAWSAYRHGAEAREAKAIANLERWRDEADARAISYLRDIERERRWGAYWRSWAGALEYRMTAAGIELPPRPMVPDERSETS